jgi:hypothetical protein
LVPPQPTAGGRSGSGGKVETKDTGTDTCNLRSTSAAAASVDTGTLPGIHIGMSSATDNQGFGAGTGREKPSRRAGNDILFDQITGGDGLLRSASSEGRSSGGKDATFGLGMGGLGAQSMPPGAFPGFKANAYVESLEPQGKSNATLSPLGQAGRSNFNVTARLPVKAPSTKHMVPNPNAEHSKNLLMKIQLELSAKRQQRANI